MAFENLTGFTFAGTFDSVAALKAFNTSGTDNLAVALVRDAQAYVVWLDDSLADEDEPNGILRPDAIAAQDPGRWIFKAFMPPMPVIPVATGLQSQSLRGDGTYQTAGGGGGGQEVYTAVVSNKAELAAVPGATLGGGVLTLPPDVSIFIKGEVDMTDQSPTGATFGDRLALSAGVDLQGYGPVGRSAIRGNVSNGAPLITIPANVGSGVEITGLRFDNVGTGPRILAEANTGGGWVVQRCFFEDASGSHIEITGTLVGAIADCYYGTAQTLVLLASNVADLTLSRVRQASGTVQSILQVTATGTIGEISLTEVRTVNAGTGGVLFSAAATVGLIQINQCEFDGNGTNVNFGSATIEKAIITGNRFGMGGGGVRINSEPNILSAIITDNIFELGRWNCFSNIDADTPKNSTQSQFRCLRSNLSVQGTAIFLLNETPHQSNTPPNVDP